MSISEFPKDIFDSSFKRKCLETLLENGISSDQVTRAIPPSISSFLVSKLFKDEELKSLLSSTNVSSISISAKERKLPTEALREILSSHVEILSLKYCDLPSDHLDERDLLSLQSESSKLHTLIIDEIAIKSSEDSIMKSFGSSMERLKNLRIGSLSSSDSIHQADEIFIRLARDHLSKNRNLIQVDLRGSGIDLVASSSRRNLPINFAGELRRWARRLRGLAFESDVNVCKVFRILNRQCSLLKSLCLSPRDSKYLSESFDSINSFSNSQESLQDPIETLPKLKYLCLSGHFKVTDSVLKNVLKSTTALKHLNISGCPVNFEQYWQYIPFTLEELIIDQCSRAQFLKENRPFIRNILSKCPNLCIYIAQPRFQGEDLESLRGLALLHGANNLLSDGNDSFYNFSNDYDDLVSFELKVKELKEKCPCIKLF